MNEVTENLSPVAPANPLCATDRISSVSVFNANGLLFPGSLSNTLRVLIFSHYLLKQPVVLSFDLRVAGVTMLQK